MRTSVLPGLDATAVPLLTFAGAAGDGEVSLTREEGASSGVLPLGLREVPAESSLGRRVWRHGPDAVALLLRGLSPGKGHDGAPGAGARTSAPFSPPSRNAPRSKAGPPGSRAPS